MLQGLQIGDSSNAVTHFDMCQKLLVARLSQNGVPRDPALVKVYRFAAECIMYNLATLMAFDKQLDRVVNDWGTSFDCLFPESDHELSPFLGGFHDVYRLMLNINIFIRTHQPANAKRNVPFIEDHNAQQRLAVLRAQLHVLENDIPASYQRAHGDQRTKLYVGKRRVSVLAMKIHLLKLSKPATIASDALVQQSVQEAIEIFRHEDLREPGNPALRWPLTLLACATETEMDLHFFIDRMKEFEVILDPSNAFKLRCAYVFLQQWPERAIQMRLNTPMDILLEPMCPAKPPSES